MIIDCAKNKTFYRANFIVAYMGITPPDNNRNFDHMFNISIEQDGKNVLSMGYASDLVDFIDSLDPESGQIVFYKQTFPMAPLYIDRGKHSLFHFYRSWWAACTNSDESVRCPALFHIKSYGELFCSPDEVRKHKEDHGEDLYETAYCPVPNCPECEGRKMMIT